ncbi:putative Mitotic spindle checkpoint component mad3 [Glarea lozoyensis 74030]|uniref:Putative Mitotic spindle checkpoint component mad3 n=1 Tax=Glarea lozoyensis (strain ATCC 74030 / MF5533) TaxID=1104152 RepID=H0EFD4_GLAL7|nr:putative Mitotic spindle checkpoint component mad3 [Glarea lozoyensis 74030]
MFPLASLGFGKHAWTIDPSSIIHIRQSLNIGAGKKITATIMFSIGSLATIISIVRLRYLMTFGSYVDTTWDDVDAFVWSVIENSLALSWTCGGGGAPRPNESVAVTTDAMPLTGTTTKHDNYDNPTEADRMAASENLIDFDIIENQKENIQALPGGRSARALAKFAAWLEGAGRWTQAEEVYKLGIDKEARPAPRLLRKFNEFQQRYAQQPEDVMQPSSPALPTVRAALGVKVDPFAAAAPRDPQAPRPNSGVGGSATTKSGKPKLAIFSDADEAAPAVSGAGTTGWQSIGSLSDRKKENVMAPKPMVGETLKAGGKKSSTKMAVFKDED